jgi:hypothetical protein
MFTTSAETTELELVILPVAMSDDPGVEDQDEEGDEETGPEDEDLEDLEDGEDGEEEESLD